MKIEFPARWIKYKDDKESKEERKLDRIIGRDDDSDIFDEKHVEFSFEPLVVDTKDIQAFNKMDDELTIIRMSYGFLHVVRVPYQVFKAIYTHVTGEEIKSVENFNFQK